MRVMVGKYPILKFKYSRIYNRIFKEYLPESKKVKIPSYEEVIEKKEQLEEYWNRKGKKILRSISRISGLRWKEKYIDVYINSCCPVFSKPLTLSTVTLKSQTKKRMEIDLIHELIHVILSENYDPNCPLTIWIEENYPDEEYITKVHIMVHAIQTGVLLDLGMEEDLISSAERSTVETYLKSWNIVKKEGWEKIIKILKK